MVILNRFLQSNSAINILVGALLGAAACWALMNTQHNVSQHKLSALADDLQSQTYQLSEVRVSVDNKLTHVTQRVAEMQARMQRIDALGEHLTYAAGIEVGEFNFDQPIPSGGPVSSMGQLLPTMSITDLEMELNRLDSALADRYTQLSLLQKEIRHIDHFEQTKLEGRPVHTGWLSSHYGYRSDPFTGKKAWHNGVDFAGKLGSDIIAIAGGVVTFSGVKGGYGYMVEISHADGFVTRYGHNKKNVVDVGDVVEKGQTIAMMGSTGRSTGPHVHLEVTKDGKSYNPARYFQHNSH